MGPNDGRDVPDEGVDPATVPIRRLRSGDVPAIGLGTVGSDHVDHDSVARAVTQAIRLGYRHLDCASVYGNEATIGRDLAELFAAGDAGDRSPRQAGRLARHPGVRQRRARRSDGGFDRLA